MKIKRKLSALLFLYSLLWSPLGIACSCMGILHDELVEQTDLAFSGVVKDYWFHEYPDGRIHYIFNAIEMYKGTRTDDLEIYVSSSDEASCGYRLKPNTVYRVYADKDGVGYRVGFCSIQEQPAIDNSSTVSELSSSYELDRETNLELMHSLSLHEVAAEKKRQLISAGCKFVTNSIAGGECDREGRNGPTICVGDFIMAFSAKDGSVGQQDFPYRWNIENNTFALDQDDYHQLTIEDCVNGINQ